MTNRQTTLQFGYREDGRIFAEDVPIAELIEQYGTPLNVVSTAQLLSNLRRLHEGCARGWDGPVRVLPAIKSNTSLALCRVLSQETPGCDLFSEGELTAALRGGFDPRCLSLNGNSKIGGDLRLLRMAIENDVRITLDDAEEFAPIESIAKELGRPARIRLRMRVTLPDVNAATDFPVHGPLPADIANQAYKAGIPREDFIPLGRRALASPHVELIGLHVHFGRHRRELEFWRSAMASCARFVAELRQLWDGWEPGEIDVGGGFAQHLDPMAGYPRERSFERQFRLLSVLMRVASLLGPGARYGLVARLLAAERRKISRQPGPDLQRADGPILEDYSSAASAALRDGLRSAGIDTSEKVLEIEPGRSLFGSAAVHVTRVAFIKRQTQPLPWTWVVTDTSEVWLHGGGHPPLHPYLVDGKPIDRYPADRRLVADIAGKSCGPDQILGDTCLPGDLRAGDTIVLVGTGAYEDMQSSNFNSMPRPAAALVDGERHALIRRRENLDDVFDRELLPEWLEDSRAASAGEA